MCEAALLRIAAEREKKPAQSEPARRGPIQETLGEEWNDDIA